MATYAVGDVQGCMASLEGLLSRIGYRPRRDRIWLVGDLVNRGPRSADVLRWARAAGNGVVAVLGNHDLHLLARAAGVAEKKRRDTLDDVLDARDAGELLAWLRARPLVHREAGFFMVHAGMLPGWTVDDAERLAREIETVLSGPQGEHLLSDRGALAGAWRADLPRWERIKLALAIMTRIRVCQPDGRVDFCFDGAPGEAPPGMRPWHELRSPADRETLVHGHWSRLGLVMTPGHIALDTGCVYGGALTAVRLEDRARFHQPALER